MSIAELKAEVDRLSPEEQKLLTDYLLLKGKLSDKKLMDELCRKIDDKNPANWVTLEEAGKRLFPNA
jgi:hypothetical protein